MGGGFYLAEGLGRGFRVAVGAGGGLDDFGDLELERVEAGVAAVPGVGEGIVVEAVEAAFGIECGDERRAGGE